MNANLIQVFSYIVNLPSIKKKNQLFLYAFKVIILTIFVNISKIQYIIFVIKCTSFFFSYLISQN